MVLLVVLLAVQACCYRGVNSCPDSLTNLDKNRFSRPERVQPPRVSAAFREVILPGHVREMIQAETSSRQDQEQPHHLACSLICERAWPAIIRIALRQASPTSTYATQGVILLSHSVSNEAASDILDKRNGAD